MRRFTFIAFALIGICLGCSSSSDSPSTTAASPSGSTTSGTAGAVAYSDVQAIFDKSCVKCHGADNPKAGISLVNHESLVKGGAGGPTILAGDPDKSLLIQALRGKDGKKQMPVGASPLAEEDIKKIETWVKDGAKA
jgi:mono/diheme cytochrome c family protein